MLLFDTLIHPELTQRTGRALRGDVTLGQSIHRETFMLEKIARELNTAPETA